MAPVRNFSDPPLVLATMNLWGASRPLGSGRYRLRTLVVLLGAVASLAGAPVALGGAQATSVAVQRIFDQCSSGHLSGDYTVGQLQRALSVMPASVSEYTSCPDVVQTAIVRTQRHRGADAAVGSHGMFLPLPVIALLAALTGTAAVLGVLAVRRR